MKTNRTAKQILAALAIIISLSACSLAEKEEIISTDAPLSSESSSAEEIIIEPEPIPEPEPVPEPAVYLSSYNVLRGSHIIISAENVDLSECVFTDSFGYERTFFEKDGVWYCFIPVKTSQDPGYYNLSFQSGDYKFSTTVTVEDKTFRKQYLTVEPATLEETLEDAAVRAAFDEFFQEYRFNFTETPLWEGAFMWPLGSYAYRETTSFGTFRTFSNGDTEYHNAIDMAAPGGQKIYATNSGTVVFAGWLGLTGNTVVLDHGCGIMSWHYHLEKLGCEEGQQVAKGDVIGRVGTTGLSTGNHLHFGITVGGIFVDPAEFMETEPNLEFWKVTEE